MGLKYKGSVKLFSRFTVLITSVLVLLSPIVAEPLVSAAPSMTNYPISCPLTASNPNPSGITTGPDGALWFTLNDGANSYVGRVSTSGSMTCYLVASDYDSPVDITTGPDGALWFTLYNPGYIGRITTSGSLTEYSTGGFRPSFITTGSDGTMWFTITGTNYIGQITTSGAITYHNLPTANSVVNITSGPDGALWLAEYGSSGSIGRYTTDGSYTAFSLPSSNVSLGDIATGSDGALWFTDKTDTTIGRISTSGTITEYPVPTASANLGSITSGSDGALWFTEFNNNKIGRIDTSGNVTEYSASFSVTNASDIISGPDGNIWFTNDSSYSISKVNIAVTIPSAPTNLNVTTPTQNPSLSWDAVSGADTYNIYRNGSLIDSITTSNVTSYTDNNAPEGTSTYYVTAANTAGESGPSNSVNVLADRTAPTLGAPTWSTNPMLVGSGNSTLTVPASDSGSGVAGGEYFIGTDPGIGNATAMTYGSGNLTASFGSSLTAGVYTIGVRAQDAAGNWSPTTTTMLVIYDSTTTLGMTGKNKKDLIPSTANGDVMPGLMSGATDKADYGFTVQYKAGVLDSHNKFSFNYATNGHTFSLTSTGFDWMTTGSTNNSQGWFQGTATVTVDGVTTTNPFWATGTDGDKLTPTTNDYLMLKVYAPGANPATATPIYQASGSMASKNSVKIQ